jgi:hypothetical protein
MEKPPSSTVTNERPVVLTFQNQKEKVQEESLINKVMP